MLSKPQSAAVLDHVIRTVVMILVLSTTARADELDDARALEAHLEYEKALALIESAIAHGNTDHHRLAATTVALCAWRENAAQNDWNLLHDDPMPHDFSQLRAIEDRGRAWALAANLGLGLTGVGAIAAGITFAITPDSIGVAGRF